MRRLNFHHLHYFWAVAKEGNLTRAAQSLHVAQSALSTQIRALEDQLGYPLFIRSGRNLLLTEAGRLALDYAESIFALGNELKMTLQGAQQANQQLRIGAVATLSRNFQENLLRTFLGRRDVRITLESGSLGELLERLALHKLDVVLSNTPVSTDAQHQPHQRSGEDRCADQQAELGVVEAELLLDLDADDRKDGPDRETDGERECAAPQGATLPDRCDGVLLHDAVLP